MEDDQEDFITKFQVFLESEPVFFNLSTTYETYLESTQSLCTSYETKNDSRKSLDQDQRQKQFHVRKTFKTTKNWSSNFGLIEKKYGTVSYFFSLAVSTFILLIESNKPSNSLIILLKWVEEKQEVKIIFLPPRI